MTCRTWSIRWLGPSSRPPAHCNRSSAPALRLRRLISLASESSEGEATSASTLGDPSSGAFILADWDQVTPARRRAVLHAADSTALGSPETAVSRRGAARTPRVPLITQPPPLLGTRRSRERRPLRVVAVTVTSELMPD